MICVYVYENNNKMRESPHYRVQNCSVPPRSAVSGERASARGAPEPRPPARGAAASGGRPPRERAAAQLARALAARRHASRAQPQAHTPGAGLPARQRSRDPARTLSYTNTHIHTSLW